MIVEIADCETNGLLDTMDRIWMIQIGRADSEDVDVYADQPGYPPIREGIERLKRADRYVFHNGCKFDMDAINMIYPGTIVLDKMFDTMIVGSMLEPTDKAISLKDVGRRMGIHKGEHSDWSRFSEEMVTYGKQDIVVTRARYRELVKMLDGWPPEVIDLEQRVAYIIGLQERNGFLLDVKRAVALEAELRQEVTDIERELQVAFPPRWVAAKKEPFVPKRDNKAIGYVANVALTKITLEVFNPGSRPQIADRFIKKYGWKPRKFTESGAPAIDEDVVAKLKYPEAKILNRYLRVSKLLGQLSDGKNGWLKLVKESGRVHGRVNTCGAQTLRMTHFSPNMAQADKKEKRMRECWTARPHWKLVGCDAEGLEARMLAHYLAKYDGGSFGDKVVNGKKEDGTDVHTSNLNACKPYGLASRDGAKTELYALMYGAGDPKLGITVKEDCRNNGVEPPKRSNAAIGADIRKALAKSMVGIDKLTDKLKRIKKKNKGWIPGIMGHRIRIDYEHTLLNYLLQHAGAIVMKMALVIFHFEACAQNKWVHGIDLGYCANVHDEVQIECREEISDLVGRSFAQCIVEAGRRLGVRCALAGDYAIGNNWKETH